METANQELTSVIHWLAGRAYWMRPSTVSEARRALSPREATLL